MQRYRNLKWSKVVRIVGAVAMVLALSVLLFPPATPAAGQAGQVQNRALSLARDAAGRPWAVWVVDSGVDTDVYYSHWTGRAWQSPLPLSADPGAWEDSPSLAFAAGSEAGPWAAWTAGTGPGQASILVSRWLGHLWSEPVEVPGTASLAGGQPALAAAPDGTLWLAWVGRDGTDAEIFVSRWDGAEWSDPELVGNDDADPMAYDTHPQLAVDGDGRVWIVWVSYEGPLNDEIHASYWDGASWSPQQQINAADNSPDVWPSLALDAAGQPWVAWYGAAAEEDGGRWRIYASHWDAASSDWSDEALVSSPPGFAVDEEHPNLAFDDDGLLHLVWSVSGAISGIAHSTWDGAAWTSPTWTPTAEPVDAPIVAPNGEVELLWLAPDGSDEAPVQRQGVDGLLDRLPRSLPSRSTPASTLSDYVANRHLAHGDSITCGCYEDNPGQPATPYPEVLEARLDGVVPGSEVINSGLPGEKARAAQERLQASLQTYRPQYVEILEGTNDVTRDYSPAQTAYAVRLLIWEAQRYSGIVGIQVIVATLTPRLDHHEPLIQETNVQIYWVAGKEFVPVADQWQAFHNYGPIGDLYAYDPEEPGESHPVHPNSTGLAIVANTFFQTMVDAGMLPDDTTPPTAWISSLPSQSECGAVAVGWDGDDGGGSGVASFDVQSRDNGGAWTDWLVQTPNYSGTYLGAEAGHTMSFRVRARDQVGNLGNYSTPATTQIVDNAPPHAVGVALLLPYNVAPFTVSWWGQDACGQVTKYDVEYRVGTGSWQGWLSKTAKTSSSFNPGSPQCGQTYSFRARAYDQAGNVSAWSDGTTSTVLACHVASGHVRTVRETPIYGAEPSASSAELGAYASDTTGYYTIYFSGSGNRNISVAHHRYGALPAQKGVAVSGHKTGVDFYLPPPDDRVDNGGFEGSTWGAWQRLGSSPPALDAEAHTGDKAALLDPGGGDSRLRQSLTLPVGPIDPTLSLMVRLDRATGSTTLTVKVTGASTMTKDLTVSAGDWAHAWYDLSAFSGQSVVLELSVTGSRGVFVDEVSMGSALTGAGSVYLPLVISNR